MAAIKKYNGSTFIDAAIRKYSTASEIIVPPTTIYTDGTSITSYTIKGNTVQNGTPTPSAPVPVVGVGELETTGEHTGEYKIPISSGQTALTPVYLSEPLMGIATADTLASSGTVTRAYKKVVLNSNTIIGTYTTQWGIAFVIYVSNVSSGAGSALIDAVCSHYGRTTRDNIWRSTGSTLRAITLAGENNAFLISDPTYTTLQDFKDYIGTQYNNGTPITVIVAVATPTTETVTAPSIPTTDGANSISVDTTVQPSEFTATWTGWHDSSVKEYDGTNWQ